MIGDSAARPAGEVPGITIKAQRNVLEHNINVYGFFIKPGVNCSDFAGMGVPNPAVNFGAFDLVPHPENGRDGCLVQAETIKFLKVGTISFQFTLTETGAFTGTDTIDDTAVVTPNAVQRAEALVHAAISKEGAANMALERFKKTERVADLRSAHADAIQAARTLITTEKLQLPGHAEPRLAEAAGHDEAAAIRIEAAIKNPPSLANVLIAQASLARAARNKRSALEILGKA